MHTHTHNYIYMYIYNPHFLFGQTPVSELKRALRTVSGPSPRSPVCPPHALVQVADGMVDGAQVLRGFHTLWHTQIPVSWASVSWFSKTINPETSSQNRCVHPQVTSIWCSPGCSIWTWANVGVGAHMFLTSKNVDLNKNGYIVFSGFLLHTMSVMSKNGVFTIPKKSDFTINNSAFKGCRDIWG